jgi:hypothetical protein
MLILFLRKSVVDDVVSARACQSMTNLRVSQSTVVSLFRNEEKMKLLATLALLGSATAATFDTPLAFGIKVGDKVPSVNVHSGFPPEMVNVADYVKGRNTIIVGLPGAFTPTASTSLFIKCCTTVHTELEVHSFYSWLLQCIKHGDLITRKAFSAPF